MKRFIIVISLLAGATAYGQTPQGQSFRPKEGFVPNAETALKVDARQVAFATLYTRGFSSLVASTAALIATGWSEPVPGRVYPRCGPAPFHGAPDNAT
jgi:hypothetical protein